MIYIKFILGQLKILLMIVFSAIFVYPFVVYPKRRKIWEMRYLLHKKWYYWYADTSETKFGSDENNYINSFYGLYELVKKRDINGKWVPDYDRFAKFSKLRKFFLSVWWGVARNGVWGYILANGPKQGEPEDVDYITDEGEGGYWMIRNKTLHGKQSVKWSVDGTRYFRYSFTKKASWYNIQRLGALIFSLKWHRYYTFVWGASSNRFLLKSRTFNLQDR